MESQNDCRSKFDCLNKFLDAPPRTILSEKELKSSLRQCISGLETLLAQSVNLRVGCVNFTELTDAKSEIKEFDSNWEQTVHCLCLSNDEGSPNNLSEFRWRMLLNGWLPLLWRLCYILDELHMIDFQGNENLDMTSEQAPLDVLSLKTICVIHCGFEFIVRWGIGCRLNPLTYGKLVTQRSFSQAVKKLLISHVPPNKSPPNQIISRMFAPEISSENPKIAAVYQLENVFLRDLRVFFCARVMEKTLRIGQLRSFLLSRYCPDLLLCFMHLSASKANESIMKWGERALTESLTPASFHAQVEVANLNLVVAPVGTGLAVRSLRQLSGSARGAVGVEIGGLLSAVMCLDGGLEAVLDSFVGPVNASQAAEDGNVEAVEALATHLARTPVRIDSRLGFECQTTQSMTSQYLSYLCPQIADLLQRSLFVYGLGNVIRDDTQSVEKQPPRDALPGLMAHMVLRLIGKISETATGDKLDEQQVRKAVLLPLLRPLMIAGRARDYALSQDTILAHPHELHRSLVVVHALSKLVSPTPALVRILTFSEPPLDSSQGPLNNPTTTSGVNNPTTTSGVVPVLIKYLSYLATLDRKTVSAYSTDMDSERLTKCRVQESLVSLLSMLSPTVAVESIIRGLNLTMDPDRCEFARLESRDAKEASAVAAINYCVSDGVVIVNQSYGKPKKTVLESLLSIDNPVDIDLPQLRLSVVVETCHSLVLEVDAIGAVAKTETDFVMSYLFEKLLSNLLDAVQGPFQARSELALFAFISTNIDPLQLLASSRAGLGVLRTLVKLVPTLLRAFGSTQESVVISSRLLITSLVLELLSTVLKHGPPPPPPPPLSSSSSSSSSSSYSSSSSSCPPSSLDEDRESLLKSLVVPLGQFSVVLSEMARLDFVPQSAIELDEELDEECPQLLQLSQNCQALHLVLLRRWNVEPPPPTSPWLGLEKCDEFLQAILERSARDLVTPSVPIRAHAVFEISETLTRITEDSQRSIPQLSRSMLIEEIDTLKDQGSCLGLFANETLGSLLGVLFGMLADQESYVYLGAVHALNCLTSLPPQSARTRHLKLLVSCFAQSPVPSEFQSLVPIVCKTMDPLLRFHASQANFVPSFILPSRMNSSHKADVGGHIIPLSWGQRLSLGEALVLSVRWSGPAAPHHASILFPALIRGACPPPHSDSELTPELRLQEMRATAAMRASCFSALAEVGGMLGWGVQRYAADLVDLCCGCLRLERDASVDLFKEIQNPGDQLHSPSHALAARRAAAFLGMQLMTYCGLEMLTSNLESLRKLHSLFLEINEGPGVRRATGNLSKSVEWGLETDPVVRGHVISALEAMDFVITDQFTS